MQKLLQYVLLAFVVAAQLPKLVRAESEAPVARTTVEPEQPKEKQEDKEQQEFGNFGWFEYEGQRQTLKHVVAIQFRAHGYTHTKVVFTRRQPPLDLLQEDIRKQGFQWMIPHGFKLSRAFDPSIILHFKEEEIGMKSREGKVLSTKVETLLGHIHVKSGKRSFSLGGPRPMPDWWPKSDKPPAITLQFNFEEGRARGRVTRQSSESDKTGLTIETEFDIPIQDLGDLTPKKTVASPKPRENGEITDK